MISECSLRSNDDDFCTLLTITFLHHNTKTRVTSKLQGLSPPVGLLKTLGKKIWQNCFQK